MNAFTAKPDLRDFVKQVRHSQLSSSTSTKRIQNPSEQQKHFLQIKDDTMSATAIRGNWPQKKTPPPKAKGPFKAVEVEFDYSLPIQAPGQSIYEEWLEYLFGNPVGKVAIDCKTMLIARRFAHAVQRRIDRMGKKNALRVTFRQVDGVVRVWILPREKTQ